MNVLDNGSSTVVLTVPHPDIVKSRYQPFVRLYRDQEPGLVEIAQKVAEETGQSAVINDTKADVNSEFTYLPGDEQCHDEFYGTIRELRPKLVIDLHGMANQGSLLNNSNRDGLPIFRRWVEKTQKGVRPHVDIEWRRKHGMTTTKGVTVATLGKFISLRGFTVGYEMVYPGGQVISRIADMYTDALALEINRTVRTVPELRDRLSLGISDFVRKFLGEDVRETFNPMDVLDVESVTQKEEAEHGEMEGMPIAGEPEKKKKEKHTYIG